MAESESIGSVSVQITGDTSQLNAAFSAAQTQASAAGARIAQSFSAGSGSVDELASATVAAAAAEAGFAEATDTASASLGHQVTQIQAVSGALRTFEGTGGIRAAERFLTLIPGVGAALQFAFPVVGAIALAESITRVIGKSEELKAAEKELTDATQKADDAFAHMEQTLDHLNVEHVKAVFGGAAGSGAEATVLEQQAQRIRVQMDDLKDSINEVAYAEAKSLKNYIPFHSNEASVDKIKAIGQQYRELGNILEEIEGKAKSQREDQGRQATQEAGQLAAKRIEAAEQAAVRAAQISKQQYDAEVDAAHAAEQQRIAGIESEYARVVQTGQEQIRFERAKEDEIAGYALATRDRTIKEIAAKAGAESAGKSAPEQALIYAGAQADTQKAKDEYALTVGKAALDVQKAQGEAALKLDELNQKVAQTLKNDVREGWDRVTQAERETAKVNDETATKSIEAQTRIAEIQDKAAGEVKALDIARQKIAYEREYALQVGHTGEQQVAYARRIASFDSQERAAKLAALQAQLRDAQALDSTLRDKEKEAQLEAQIAVLKQQNANADAQESAAADELNQKLTETLSLQQQTSSAKAAASDTLQQNNQQAGAAIGQAIANLPKDIGDDIGQSISNALLGSHPGESIGKAMAKGLEDSLKQTLGGILKTAISSVFQIGLSFLGFAGGTNDAPGGVAMVGEKGPELVMLPQHSQVIPNHALKKYADGTPGWQQQISGATYQSTAFQTGTTELHFHAHGMQNPDAFIDHVMRKLPEALKRRSPTFSPLSR
jgi:hypothetical protein